ncbi:hypothetical protein JXB01_00555 [Candidatus Micrarchaeota archaeon]|nr:hypothetical protein [Candidatus Micrarchaeota archaeon]
MTEETDKKSGKNKGIISIISAIVITSIALIVGPSEINKDNIEETKLSIPNKGEEDKDDSPPEKKNEGKKSATATKKIEIDTLKITEGINNAQKVEALLKEFGYSGYNKNNIIKFQKMLRMLGYKVPVNGKMKPDDSTWNAAQEVKKEYMGMAPEELKDLIDEKDLVLDAKGETVVLTQIWIFLSGQHITIDGHYGSNTDGIYKELTGYWDKLAESKKKGKTTSHNKKLDTNKLEKELEITGVYLGEVYKKVSRLKTVHGTPAHVSELLNALNFYDQKLEKIEKRMEELLTAVDGDLQYTGKIKGMLQKVKNIRGNIGTKKQEADKKKQTSSISELKGKYKENVKIIAKNCYKQPPKKQVFRRKC